MWIYIFWFICKAFAWDTKALTNAFLLKFHLHSKNVCERNNPNEAVQLSSGWNIAIFVGLWLRWNCCTVLPKYLPKQLMRIYFPFQLLSLWYLISICFEFCKLDFGHFAEHSRLHLLCKTFALCSKVFFSIFDIGYYCVCTRRIRYV